MRPAAAVASQYLPTLDTVEGFLEVWTGPVSRRAEFRDQDLEAVWGGSTACDGLRTKYRGVGAVSAVPTCAVGHAVFDKCYWCHSFGEGPGAFQHQEPVTRVAMM